MRSHHGNIQPPLFFSSAVDGAPRDGGTTFLSRLSDKSDVSRLIVFDTWIRNVDRYVGDSANSDNLIYAIAQKGRTYDLVPIDHSHCFVEIGFDELPNQELVSDPEVYGFFPEFAGYVKASAVADALGDLSNLDDDFVEQCVNSVPPDWGLTVADAQHLTEFICDRARYVVETIGMQLIDDPQFVGF